MNNGSSTTAERLTTCFRSVFPDLDDSEITGASMASLATWDSLASVTMVSIVEEEFGIRIDDSDLENFVSFKLIEGVLEKHLE